MAYVRFTILKPKLGDEEEAKVTLQALDSHIARSPGLLLSLVTASEGGNLGRLSVWRSKEEANREAMNERTLSLRARLTHLGRTEEHLFEVASGQLRDGLTDLISLYAPPDELRTAV
jgi:hypothetical protein